MDSTESFTEALKWEPRESFGRVLYRRLKPNRVALMGGFFIIFLSFIAVMAPLIAPYDPAESELAISLQSPNPSRPFGTDEFGRDILSRIIYGARVSLLIGLVSVSIGALGGVLLGVISGFYGGKVDNVIMSVINILLSFPGILLALLFVTIVGVGAKNIMFSVGIYSVPTFARLVRGSVLSVREREYVEAARALGFNDFRVVFRHIFPNVLAPIIVQSTFSIASAIRIAAGLSFLGLGVEPPTPEWGAMLSDGRGYLEVAPHICIIPGTVLFLTVMAFNLFGDGLRDALDPFLKEA